MHSTNDEFANIVLAETFFEVGVEK